MYVRTLLKATDAVRGTGAGAIDPILGKETLFDLDTDEDAQASARSPSTKFSWRSCPRTSRSTSSRARTATPAATARGRRSWCSATARMGTSSRSTTSRHRVRVPSDPVERHRGVAALVLARRIAPARRDERQPQHGVAEGVTRAPRPSHLSRHGRALRSPCGCYYRSPSCLSRSTSFSASTSPTRARHCRSPRLSLSPSPSPSPSSSSPRPARSGCRADVFSRLRLGARRFAARIPAAARTSEPHARHTRLVADCINATSTHNYSTGTYQRGIYATTLRRFLKTIVMSDESQVTRWAQV